MRGFKIRNNISPHKKDVRGLPFKKLPSLDLGYFLLLGFIIIFLVRVVIVIRSNGEIGSYASIKMLNVGMPIVNTQGNNNSENLKNDVSLKSVVLESLGLANINLVGIVGNEISYFSGAITKSQVTTNDHSSGFTKFKVNENTIAKLTPKEIAELNDVSKAYKPSLKKALASKPEVLIYHSHTMEQYSEAGIGQTTNSDVNVVGVGDILTKELEEGYGISVVHDRTNYSVSYDDAYDRSREGLKKYLEEYGSFKIVIDLHRDSTPRESIVANLNNQSLAKFMFVTSANVPTYDANVKIVGKLHDIANNLFPELIKNTKDYDGAGGINGFNQGFNEGSMIIEVGSHNNTAQEAKLTGKYIARVLAEYLNGPQ